MQAQRFCHYRLFVSGMAAALTLTACQKADKEAVSDQKIESTTALARPMPEDKAKADPSTMDKSGVDDGNDDAPSQASGAAQPALGIEPGAGEAVPLPDLTSGFTRLFNGTDTSGWTQVLDSPWTVEGGILVGRQNPSGRREGESWLITNGDYDNFILHLQFRITKGGNSGVFLRDPLPRSARLAAADGGKGPWEAGYEVNINNDEPVYPTGSVWEAAKGVPKLQLESEWNDLVIKLEGQRISTWLNGKVAVNNAELPARSTSGGIGFQRHGTAQFKDKLIEIKSIEIKLL